MENALRFEEISELLIQAAFGGMAIGDFGKGFSRRLFTTLHNLHQQTCDIASRGGTLEALRRKPRGGNLREKGVGSNDGRNSAHGAKL